MSKHKYIDAVCLAAGLLALVICVVFLNGERLGIQPASKVMGYETRLFDTTRVHTLDIVMEDWESFLSTCENEEYAVCSVVIDGEAYQDVGIRAKGNTSLSTVSSMNSDRYSFKIEFDQYDSTKSYHGLDKLSLNNLIQDATMMKDYLTYQLMGDFGAAAPLCSYVYLTVNGEDWGLYLAVEAVEDAFLQRSYGHDYGELYKPDSMNFGGGRGNGRDFNMEEFMNQDTAGDTSGNGRPTFGAPNAQALPEGGMPQGFDPSAMFGGAPPEGFDPSAMFGDMMAGNLPEGGFPMEGLDSFPAFDGGAFDLGEMPGGFGMGSGETKLQYIDDDPDSYSTIFSSAKTDITEADQRRLTASLKALSEGEEIQSVVDMEQVLRYFVVHNFVVNGDSYTGTMVHNYYLYEEDGRLSMIPWDYNLAFGTFQASGANSAVNDPIDTPLSVSGSGDRPMADWIFSSEAYTQLYHQYFAEFLENVDFAALIDGTAELIAPYVEKDPTKFYTTEAFETGVAAMREFCLLREESVLGQLSGTIPSTDAGQSADSSALVDASHLTLSDMGSMGGGPGDGGFFGGGTMAAPGDRPAGVPGAASGGKDRQPTADSAPQAGREQGPVPSGPVGKDGQSGGPRGPETRPEFGGMPTMGGAAPNGAFPTDGNGGFAPDASGTGASGASGTPLLLGVSGLVLLLGLAIAFKFKR